MYWNDPERLRYYTFVLLIVVTQAHHTNPAGAFPAKY